MSETAQRRTRVAAWTDLEDGKLAYALVAGVDLVVLRVGTDASVFYGRCLHRGVLLADGRVEGDRLVCGVHGWSYDRETGVTPRGTNNCPVGIATQQKHFRARLVIEESARRLNTFLSAAVELMQVMARACGHAHLNQFDVEDLTTWSRDMASLAGVRYAGVGD